RRGPEDRYARRSARRQPLVLEILAERIRYRQTRENIVMLRIVAATIVLLAMQAASTVFAQDWPNRPIRMVVPFVAGGSTDLTARVVAENLRPILGQTFVIDNRPG